MIQYLLMFAVGLATGYLWGFVDALGTAVMAVSL